MDSVAVGMKKLVKKLRKETNGTAGSSWGSSGF